MKIGFLITARLKSSRLPLKLLMQINGKSILEHVIDRCKLVSDVVEIILCTSTNPQDKSLVDIAKNNNIYYYLGDEDDVLQRLQNASTFYSLDYIINITGENPLFSIHHANLVVDQAKKEKNDFIYITGLPIGCAVYGIRPEALKTVCEIKEEIDTEIWGPLINRPKIFNVKEILVDEKRRMSNLRITTDYFEDFIFIQKLYSYFSADSIPSYEEIFFLLQENPNLQEIHAMHVQAGLNPEILEKINKFYETNIKKIQAIKKKNYDKR